MTRNRTARMLSAGLSWGGERDGRLLVIAMAGLYLFVVGVVRYLFSVDVWPDLGVSVGPSLFFDSRNVAAAAECRELGYDPLVDNPCDPWGRPLVYPRVWLALRWVGLDQSHTVLLGVIAGLLFYSTLMLLLRRLTLGEGLVVGVAAISPSAMFAIERANMDLVVFGIASSAVILWRARPRSIAVPLVLLGAAIAKLYPVFGLIAFLWGRGRKMLLVGLACACAFVVYTLVTIDDIKAIAASAPQGEYFSYGARIVIARLYHQFTTNALIGSDALKQIAAATPLLLGGWMLWIMVRRRSPLYTAMEADSHRLLAFHIGSLIYIGTFIASNNFDYRLIYLFLTFPQIFAWIKQEEVSELRATLARVTLVVVLAEMWISAVSEAIALADEAFSWALAGLLIALIGLSMPPLSTVWRNLIGDSTRETVGKKTEPSRAMTMGAP